MNFLLKYPSRSRPTLFKKRVENWVSMSSGKHALHWICSFDLDDPTMMNEEMQQWCREKGLKFFYGQSKTKIEAINADLRFAPDQWGIIIIVSDDMAVLKKNWDVIVAQDMLRAFPDLNGALWYLDGRQDRLCTLSIMGRPVFNELGYLYHPDFLTAYCDNFFHDLMQHTKRLRRIETPVFMHEWRHNNDDELMRRNEGRQLYAKDKATYERLRKTLK